MDELEIIMGVCDEPLCQELNTIVEGMGYPLRGVSTEEELVHRFRSHPLSLFILYIFDRSCFDLGVLPRLRKTGIRPHFVVVADPKVGGDMVLDAMKWGARDFFFKLPELRDIIVPSLQRVIDELKTEVRLKEAESALKTSEERLKMASEASHDGIFEWPLIPGSAPWWSAQMNSLLSIELGTIQPSFRRLYERIHPQDRESFRKALRAHYLNKAPFDLEIRFRDFKEAYRYLRVCGKTLYSKQGEPLKMVGAVEDVSERVQVQMQAQLDKELMEMGERLSKAGSWLLDLDPFRLYWSKMTREIHGVADNYEATSSKEAIAFYLEEDRPRIEKAVMAAIEKGEPYEFEAKIRAADGVIKWVRSTGKPIFEKKKCIRLVGAFQDISQQKRNELEILELERNFWQGQKLETFERLAGGIAHDFNNILAAINGFVELAGRRLSRSDPDHPVLQDLEGISLSSERAKSLVDQILTFSQKSDSLHSPLSLGELVKSTADLFRASFPGWLQIQFEEKAGEEFPVMGNATDLEQALANIGTNAMEAMRSMDEGQCPCLSISLKHIGSTEVPNSLSEKVETRDWALVEITDNGEGMSSEVVSRVFEPFFTTRPFGENTGLGLSVAHGIIKRHQGSITVDSREGEGTRFRIFLPLTHSKEDNGKNRAEEDVLKSGKVLLVDDEDHVALTTGLLLEELGYEVVTRSDGEAGLQAFVQNPWDYAAVITDQTMPGMSGLELARKIREQSGTVAILLISGYSSEVDADSLEGHDLDGFLKKPFTFDQMESVLSQALAQSSARKVNP